MKILQIVTSDIPVKEDLMYGGLQRIVRSLDKRYVELGHESIVAAPATSHVNGILVPTLKQGLLEVYEYDHLMHKDEEEEHYYKAINYALKEGVDVIHNHCDRLLLSQAWKDDKDKISVPVLTTLHGGAEYDMENAREIFYSYKLEKGKTYFAAISKYVKKVLSRYFDNDSIFLVYNGIDVDSFPFSSRKDDYLLSFGTIDPIKGHHIAIKVAKATNSRLVIGGRLFSKNKNYYELEIKPRIDGEQITYVGEVDESKKRELFREAKCLLMPDLWNEPFGLTAIEAGACGTPVVAFDRGALPEIIINDKTGYIVDDTNEMIEAVLNVDRINPHCCREHTENNFNDKRMARDYLKLYEKMLYRK